MHTTYYSIYNLKTEDLLLAVTDLDKRIAVSLLS
jgi:hypothetical protein